MNDRRQIDQETHRTLTMLSRQIVAPTLAEHARVPPNALYRALAGEVVRAEHADRLREHFGPRR